MARTKEQIAEEFPYLNTDDSILSGNRQQLELQYMRHIAIALEEIKDILQEILNK